MSTFWGRNIKMVRGSIYDITWMLPNSKSSLSALPPNTRPCSLLYLRQKNWELPLEYLGFLILDTPPHTHTVNRRAPVITIQIPWFSGTRYLKLHFRSLLKNQGKPQQDDSMQFCITGKRKPCRYEIRQCKILSQRNLALLHPPSIMVLFLQQLYQTRHPDIAMSSYQFSREVRYPYKQFQAHQNLPSCKRFQSPHWFPTIINSSNSRTLVLGVVELDWNINVWPIRIHLWKNSLNLT